MKKQFIPSLFSYSRIEELSKINLKNVQPYMGINYTKSNPKTSSFKYSNLNLNTPLANKHNNKSQFLKDSSNTKIKELEKNNLSPISNIFKNIFSNDSGKKLSKISKGVGRNGNFLPEAFQRTTIVNGQDSIRTEHKDSIRSLDKTPLKDEKKGGNYNENLQLKAFQKIKTEANDKGNYSLLNRLRLFEKTGDKKYLLYCPCCLHCRKNEGEMFDIKFRMKNTANLNCDQLFNELEMSDLDDFQKVFLLEIF